MNPVETVLGLLVAVAALATLARTLKVPYPVLLVLGGLALSLVPGLPAVQFPPDVAFLVFVPPLVYLAAVSAPWREFRANLRPIGSLAVGLVLVSAAAVAATAHFAAGLDWPVAFVLGTIVAPTDVIAVSAVAERLPLPRRVLAVLEGEGLGNDVTALIAYRLAVAAVVIGIPSPGRAALALAWAGAGGVAFGLAAGWLAVRVRRLLDDPPVEITVSLLTPFAAYLPAEWAGASGVLATAAAGLYVGRRGLRAFAADSRTLGMAFWRMLEFLLNGLGFILVGLQLRAVYAGLSGYPLPVLLGYAAAVCLTVIVVRIAWVFLATYLPRLLSPALRRRDPSPPWQHTAVIAWAGMRGVDSLATALAVPLTVAGGAPFPGRGLVIFLAFCVILATLVVQGLSLPLLIRWLGLRGDPQVEREEAEARAAAARAALARLEELAPEPGTDPGYVAWLRALYQNRLRRAQARLGQDGQAGGPEVPPWRLRLELLRAERQAVIDLHNRGVIGDEALREVERDLDLEELRLDPEAQLA